MREGGNVKEPNRICPICGKHFYTPTKHGKYCSKPHKATCIYCGDTFHQRGEKIQKLSPLLACPKKACQEKRREEKYGYKYIMQNPEHQKKMQEKAKEGCLEKYGVEYPLQNKEIRERGFDTLEQKYGVRNPLLSPEIQSQIKETCLEKYGTENFSTSEFGKEYLRNNFREKNIQEKIYETKRKNKTFSGSKEEDKIYDVLLTIFSEVKRYYRSEDYPFLCDFYIPSEDLYIECNFHWTHQDEPFIGSIEQLEKLKKLEEKAKSSEYYETVIDTWTRRDVQKFNVVKENNLNFLAFYTVEECEDWLNSLI